MDALSPTYLHHARLCVGAHLGEAGLRGAQTQPGDEQKPAGFRLLFWSEMGAQAREEHLVLANLRGVDSHGVSRVGVYAERLEAGLLARETR